VVPWPFTVALLLRDAMMIACLAVLRRYGYGPPPVHYVGKTATFILLFALPILLLARITDSGFWYASGWALAWWGIVLYWLAGLFYVIQVVAAVRAARRLDAAAAG
jgi:cardiolipin synthase